MPCNKAMNKKNKKTKKSLLLHPDFYLPPIEGDFRETIQWRIFRITAEFVDGFHFIADFKKSVSVFGSSSSHPQSIYYQEARKLGRLLAKTGYAVVTGGGPGIMEAANRGAFEVNGKSVGLNIQFPQELKTNKRVRTSGKYVKNSIDFHYFFTRKVMLSFVSQIYVFFPGGFGTLDEFFEILVLVQTKKLVKPILIIVVGKEYWQPLFEWLNKMVCEKEKAINKEALKLFCFADSAEQAFKIIKKFALSINKG